MEELCVRPTELKVVTEDVYVINDDETIEELSAPRAPVVELMNPTPAAGSPMT